MERKLDQLLRQLLRDFDPEVIVEDGTGKVIAVRISLPISVPDLGLRKDDGDSEYADVG